MWRPPITCFEDDFEACIAHLRLPVKHRRLTRTTNLLERLFVEERNRLQSGELFHGSVAARKVISRGPVDRVSKVDPAPQWHVGGSPAQAHPALDG
jgi:transposase-like protein